MSTLATVQKALAITATDTTKTSVSSTTYCEKIRAVKTALDNLMFTLMAEYRENSAKELQKSFIQCAIEIYAQIQTNAHHDNHYDWTHYTAESNLADQLSQQLFILKTQLPAAWADAIRQDVHQFSRTFQQYLSMRKADLSTQQSALEFQAVLNPTAKYNQE